jgi:glycosyltransferase involved in cell wall biosynthesis
MREKAQKKNLLVIGMGSYVFGLEKQVKEVFRNAPNTKPYFLITKYGDGSVDKLLETESFEYERLPFGPLGLKKINWTIITLLNMPWLYLKFIFSYLRNKCRVILILSISSFKNAFLPIILLKYFKKAGIVFYLHGIPPDKIFYHILAYFINRLSDQIIVVSNAVKKRLMEIGIDASKVRVVFNGIDFEHFNCTSPIRLKETHNWEPETLVVGYAGQFTPQKGLRQFVASAEIVLKFDNKLRFVIAGKTEKSNEYFNSISKYINSNGLSEYIKFTGWISEIAMLYKALDIVIVPSMFEEPFGLVIIEAMASGLPVVASNVGGIPEIVVDRVTGFLVNRGDSKQIAECILALARNPELRKNMGHAAKERAKNLFDIKKNSTLVEEIILSG